MGEDRSGRASARNVRTSESALAVTPSSGAADLPGGPRPGELFEGAVRGYNRHHVDDFAARAYRQVADLEVRLTRALDESERLRVELAQARQVPADRPAHEEVSERIGRIFTLAGEQAQAQKDRAAQEIATLRFQAQQEADTSRAAAISQTEQMLAAAQEHADRAIATARAEAGTATSTALAEAEAATADALAQAEAALAEAADRSARLLNEATARAGAIRGTAEDRVGQLTGGRTNAIRQLTDIREIVVGLLVRDGARGSLADEVASTAAAALANRSTDATTAAAQQGGR
jgi:cell division septum initiation protein DivIVA